MNAYSGVIYRDFLLRHAEMEIIHPFLYTNLPEL